MSTELRHFSFLPLFKPPGPTSHDMVAAIRKLLPRKHKVGHTGTLDPFASGVLVIALGKATRFNEDVHDLFKSYRATVRLGEQTNTLDPTGEVDKSAPVPSFDQETLDRLARKMEGKQNQMPPIFSAKKVNGRKSYELARANQPVQLKPKEIILRDLRLEKVNLQEIVLDTTCSTGTYVRALGRDIAETLDTCGHLTALERTAVGPVSLDDCVRLEQLTPENLEDFAWPVSRLLPEFPEIDLPEAALSELVNGRPFSLAPQREELPPQFLGVCRRENHVEAIFRCVWQGGEQILPKQLCYRRASS